MVVVFPITVKAKLWLAYTTDWRRFLGQPSQPLRSRSRPLESASHAI